MAQVSKICSGGAQSTQIFHNNPKPHKPKSLNSLNFRSQFLASSNSWTLKHKNVCVISGRRAGAVRVSASVATPEKPSTVPEIVLQPIKEISGAITLPGSKSLSNRILLLAALSEVYDHCVLVATLVFLLCSGGIWFGYIWVCSGSLDSVRKCRKV